MWIISRLGFLFLQINRAVAAVAAGSAEYYIGLFGLTEKIQSYIHFFLIFSAQLPKSEKLSPRHFLFLLIGYIFF
jgi:hypothetical protein